ncbi:L-seryl-tRNA(Sec) selenium transferase [Aneurinibacillus sp. Ricciae_BoGa-3]|uniref:L-seryl-tRNA(Sec) selenium transferase n=1 Tax=Aneurinibacillus sp. Ricciae_BoGa-3 TaxID=3022697 RepID=UPI00233FEC62|nr:L-seryl-tRNA(Sec) selenium transferase [Aneurinibacillus sp. Ricciae_BoGa-3]WCK54693.1 L-seryl-tRNA(Sec) selenium transferase [Aneurinibacillus sp. Ricciae_BoGa-3]
MSGFTNQQQNRMRSLPSVHKLAYHPAIVNWREEYSYTAEEVTALAQQLIEQERKRLLSGEGEPQECHQNIDDWVMQLKEAVEKLHTPSIVPVINGTGIILHTNLGRAVLSERAVEQMVQVARSYSNLEYNVAAGSRGSRHELVEHLVTRITGAEAAMVVNNNAAAVFLILRELAKGREVLISRGQLVEIGGSFRISEIMEESGAILREVGTTNKTHPYDYERAISSETALVMRVHTSNFTITGFTEEVRLPELVQIAHSRELPVYEDLGSGVLYDLAGHGIGQEPVASAVIKAGADVISFSGDKLLGGPQAGIIAGKSELINRLKKNQLARILRVDKVTLAALEATLLAYLKPELAIKEIPTLRAILTPADEIKARVYAFAGRLKEQTHIEVRICKGESEVGGGTLPGVRLPTWTAAIRCASMSTASLEKAFRRYQPAIIGRVQDDWFILDFRTIHHSQEGTILLAINQIVDP